MLSFSCSNLKHLYKQFTGTGKKESRSDRQGQEEVTWFPDLNWEPLTTVMGHPAELKAPCSKPLTGAKRQEQMA